MNSKMLAASPFFKNVFQITEKDLYLGNQLGSGSYGCVQIADWVSRKIEVAVKKAAANKASAIQLGNEVIQC